MTYELRKHVKCGTVYREVYRRIILPSERRGKRTGGGVQAADGELPRWKLHAVMAAPKQQITVRQCGDKRQK